MKEDLKNILIDNSLSKDFVEAIEEWRMVSMETDINGNFNCLCGQQNIKYLYKIRNVKNKNILYPIGSSCIHYFNNSRLNNELKIIQNGEEIFNHGKYSGKKINEIVENYPDYIVFLINERKQNNKVRKNNDYNKLINYYKLINGTEDYECDNDKDEYEDNDNVDNKNSGICIDCGNSSIDKNGFAYKKCFNCTKFTGKCEKCGKNSIGANGIKYQFCFNCKSCSNN